MIRLNINSSKNATLLYHFTSSWDKLDSIVTSKKLNPSTVKEPHGQKSKKFADDSTSYYVSTTRTPSTIYNASPEWRFAVILDGSTLSDKHTIRPYQYNTSEHNLAIFVSSLDGKNWTYFVDIDQSPKEHRLTDAEMDEFLDIFYEWADADDPRVLCDEEKNEYDITFILGEGKNKFNPENLPPLIRKMLRLSGYESEDRVFTEGLVDISKALVGVLVPDVEYFTADGEEFREKHPNLKMYIYRDPRTNKHTEQYKNFQMHAEDDPSIKKLYRLPIL